MRYYQAWNEPNHYRHLNPQYEATRPPSSVPPSETVPNGTPFLSADVYRSLLMSSHTADTAMGSLTEVQSPA